MATKHYFEYLQGTMIRRWNNLALKDLDGENSYTYAELAAQIKRLHLTFEIPLEGISSPEKASLPVLSSFSVSK